MSNYILEFFSNWDTYPKIVTTLLAMLPFTELRGALPWGVFVGKMNLQSAFFYAVLGNYLISIPLLLFLEPVSKYLSRYRMFDNFFKWLFMRTRKKSVQIEKYGFWGLVIFVGIPLPVTGAWTGSVAAFLFDLPRKKSFVAIFLGLLMSATIVSVLIETGKMVVM